MWNMQVMMDGIITKLILTGEVLVSQKAPKRLQWALCSNFNTKKWQNDVNFVDIGGQFIACLYKTE